jgi:hypothetical protein
MLPSGKVVFWGVALRFTVTCADAATTPRRRRSVTEKTVFKLGLTKWDRIALLLS